MWGLIPPLKRVVYPSLSYYIHVSLSLSYRLFTTMNNHQPEASTSTSPPPSKHYCSLVIDPGLPREQYLKLIEAEGVVHSLVQRLLEKHGGDKNVCLQLKYKRRERLMRSCCLMLKLYPR
jgi:hypothetical protein